MSMNLTQKFFLASSVLSLAIGPVAMASENGEVKSETKVRGEKVTLTAEQRTCVVTALTKREDALIAAEQTFATNWKSALEARKTALVIAWNTESRSERLVAQRAAAKTFEASKKAARKTEEVARKTAWDTFKTERKACTPKAASEDTVDARLDF